MYDVLQNKTKCDVNSKSNKTRFVSLYLSRNCYLVQPNYVNKYSYQELSQSGDQTDYTLELL